VKNIQLVNFSILSCLLVLFTSNLVAAEDIVFSRIQVDRPLNSAILAEDRQLPNLPEPRQIDRSIAQIQPSFPPKVPVAFSSLVLTNPTSPAAKLIGASDRIVGTISTPDQFGFEVLNGLDNDGNFNTGISVDTLPYVLIKGNGLTLEEYRNSGFQRFLANTKLSIATTKATDNSSIARAGLGLEFVLLNEGDPRRDLDLSQDLLNIQAEINDKVREVGGPKATPQLLKETAAAFNPKIQAAKTRAEIRAGKQPMWTAAIGQSWVSPTGLYGDLRGEGMGLWTTYRHSINDDAQLLFHASLRNGERISDRKKGFINADTLVGGIRLQSGNRDFRFSLETAYNRESQGGQKINDYLSFGVGLEPRIYDNSWLVLSFTGDTGRQNGSDFQFRTGIKWNINPGYIETKTGGQ
jgi:hypothetical protein